MEDAVGEAAARSDAGDAIGAKAVAVGGGGFFASRCFTRIVGAGATTALGDVGDADERFIFVEESADGLMDAGHGIGGEVSVAGGVVSADGFGEGEGALLNEVAHVGGGALAGGVGLDAVDGELDEGEVFLHAAALARGEGIEGDGVGGHGGSREHLTIT